MTGRIGFLAGIALAVSLAAVWGGAPSAQADSIALTTSPIRTFMIGRSGTKHGPLTFLGGVNVSARDRRFGGFSGLTVSADGTRILAVSDAGHWFAATVAETSDGALALSDGRIGALSKESGNKRQSDSEAIRTLRLKGKDVLRVAYEQRHRIVDYPLRDGIPSREGKVYASAGRFSRLPANGGLEALAVGPKGTKLQGATIVISERGRDQDGNSLGWILDGRSTHRFSVRRIGDYDVTDAAFLPSGDMIVLERAFSYATGPRARLRLIGKERIGPGTLADGPVLLDADLTAQIDNMEGLAIHIGSGGKPVLTLVSDDNFSLIQRTLFLRFRLDHAPETNKRPDPTPLPRARPNP